MPLPLSRRLQSNAPYPFAAIDAEVARLRADGVEVIDFGVGDPSSPTPDFVIDALKAGAERHRGSGYPSYVGEPAFRQAAVDYLRRTFGVTLDPATEISSTIGAKEAVFNFPLALLDPGDIALCPTPGYPPYKNGTRFAGAEPYFVPLLPEHDFLIDYAAIPADICRRAKIIWINYPNSPTGRSAPRAWLEGLVAWARQHDIVIAADEGCYIDIYDGVKPTSILEVAREGVITFYSLSKRNNMTGYRVGFVAGDAALVDAFKQVKTNIDSGTPNFVQEAAIAALNDDAHVEAMRAEYREKKQLLRQALAAAGLPPVDSDATFYLWQRAPEGMTGADLARRLVDLGIVVTPGAWISDVTVDGVNPGENYVRFALVPTLGQVRTACARLAEFHQTNTASVA
jgi:LL-diaminopimelate aminotransferase